MNGIEKHTQHTLVRYEGVKETRLFTLGTDNQEAECVRIQIDIDI